MAKKDSTVTEINDLLKNEIEPKLQILRDEKGNLLEFQQVQNDVKEAEQLLFIVDYRLHKVPLTVF
jgi:structural maintenance of chromosome 2